jgi:hypothetical protein
MAKKVTLYTIKRCSLVDGIRFPVAFVRRQFLWAGKQKQKEELMRAKKKIDLTTMET